MKLNIGCGDRRIAGYTGVDAVQRKAVDVIAKAWDIPLPDNCAEEILAVHIWEHFYLWECEDVIKEWRRLLAPGSMLILELPDLIKCAKNVLCQVSEKHEGQMSMWGLYGDPRSHDPFMTHRWGWTPITLRKFLESHGFNSVRDARPQFHLVGADLRDMRLEARKV
jgi:hypothetical protein